MTVFLFKLLVITKSQQDLSRLSMCQWMQTKLYTEDWIGLRTLDEAGKVQYISVPGGHLKISKGDMKKHVVPYLNSHASVERSKSFIYPKALQNRRVTSNSERKQVAESEDKALSELFIFDGSSYEWPSSVKSFLGELLGVSEDKSSSQP